MTPTRIASRLRRRCARRSFLALSYRENNQSPPDRRIAAAARDFKHRNFYSAPRLLIAASRHCYMYLTHIFPFEKLIRGWGTRDSNRCLAPRGKIHYRRTKVHREKRKQRGKRWKDRIDNEKTTYRVLWIKICTRQRERGGEGGREIYSFIKAAMRYPMRRTRRRTKPWYCSR